MLTLFRNLIIALIAFGIWAQPVFANKKQRIQEAEKLLQKTEGEERIGLLQELSKLYLDTIFNKSIDYANEIVDLSKENPKEHANSLYYLGNIYRQLHQYPQALEHHKQALEIRKELETKHDIASSFNNIGEIHKILLNKEEALKNFEASLKIRKELGRLKEIAYTLNNIGSVYWTSKDYGNSLEYYLNALDIRSQIGDKSDISSSLSNLGNVYKNLKHYNKALSYYKKALEIRTELGEQHQRAYTLNDIGGIYWRMNRYKDALDYYNQSLIIRKELDEKRYVASTLKNIGTVYKNLKELDLSLKSYNQALQIYTLLKDSKEQATIYSLIGNLFHQFQNTEKSLEYHKTALTLHKKINNPRGVAFASNNIGEILLEYGQKNKAEPYLLKAYEVAQQIQEPNLLRNTSENLFEYFSQKGNYKKALEFYRHLSESEQDSIVADHHKDRISEFEALYEISKNRDEIKNLQEFSHQQTILIYLFIAILILAIIIGYITYKNVRIRQVSTLTLASKNKELQGINARLKESELILRDLNITKDKFFNIISRDLKDPFKELNRISKDLFKNFEFLNREDKLERIKILYDTSIHTNTLVENLLLWAASQTGKTKFTPDFFNIKHMIDDKLKDLEEQIIEKNLKIMYNLNDQITAYADTNSIGEVIRNLLTNAVKFSYPKGTITLTVHEKKYMIELEICDEGVGISEDNLNKLFRLDSDYLSLGTAQEKGSGIGLLLCKEYIEKNNGKIWAESEEGKGSRFYFTLPKNNRLFKSTQGNPISSENSEKKIREQLEVK
jgi:signal transduction histidine kinase